MRNGCEEPGEACACSLPWSLLFLIHSPCSGENVDGFEVLSEKKNNLAPRYK